MAKLHLEIVTPERPVTKTDVDDLVVPGLFGQFGVLPGHTTFLSELGSGALVYTQGKETITLQVAGGFCEVRQDHITVLADQVTE